MRKLLFLTVMFLSLHCFSQNKEDALRDAKITANATLKGDFKTVLAYTHPAIIEFSGGMDVLLPQVEKMMADMKSQGLEFKKAEVDFVSDIVEEQNEHRCYIKNINIMAFNGQTIKSTSYLMGFFLKDSKHWVFTEAEKIKTAALQQQIFPDFKTALEVPDDQVEIM